MSTPTTQTRNEQTPGPLEINLNASNECKLRDDGGNVLAVVGSTYTELCPRLSRINTPERAEQDANARLLAAGFNAFDKAGRELGIDAAALAESIDLAGLIRATQGFERAERIRQSVGMGGSHNPRNDDVYERAHEAHTEALATMRAALSKLPTP